MITHVKLYYKSPMQFHDLGYIGDAFYMSMKMLGLGVYTFDIVEV